MLKQNQKILFQKLGSDAVMLHLDSEEYFELDETGTRIWDVLIEQETVDKAIPILLTEFDVDDKTLRADVNELVQELLSENILIDE